MGRLTSAIAAAIVCGLACAGAAIDPSAATQAGELSVWTAANVPHDAMVLLQCRGGAGYEFKNLGTKTSPQGEMRVAVAMTFAANAREAGQSNEYLQPGTCAAADRALAATEPREVRFIAAAFAQPYVGPIDVTPKSAEHHPDVRSIADYLDDAAHYWTFHAVDTHHGYFDATTHEDWIDRSAPPRRPDSQEQPRIARWLVTVKMAGGIAGSRREVSLNGDGRLLSSGSGTSGQVRCAVQLPAPDVQHIEAAIARSHPEAWRPQYVPKNNPGGCCDQLRYVVHLEQEDEHGQRSSRETFWFDQSAADVPAAISALFKLVYQATHACAF